MMEPANVEKREVVEFSLKQVYRGIYSAVLDARVGKKIEDEKMASGATDRLKRLEAMKDAYEEELKNLENDNGGEQGAA